MTLNMPLPFCCYVFMQNSTPGIDDHKIEVLIRSEKLNMLYILKHQMLYKNK